MFPHKEVQKVKDREENVTVTFLEDVLHQVKSTYYSYYYSVYVGTETCAISYTSLKVPLAL